MSEKKRIGIMGGTFNPIHNGHLMLAEWAMDEAELDQVIFIPTGCSYMKSDDGILTGEKRLQMAELAIKSHPCFAVSRMEIDREGNTYTCDTISQLKQELPEEDLFFIMGADCLFAIEKWKNPDKIFQNCCVIAAARNASPMNKMEQKRQELVKRFRANILLLKFPQIEISSTDIRNRIANGKSVRYLVPESVREFITRNKLYLTED